MFKYIKNIEVNNNIVKYKNDTEVCKNIFEYVTQDKINSIEAVINAKMIYTNDKNWLYYDEVYCFNDDDFWYNFEIKQLNIDDKYKNYYITVKNVKKYIRNFYLKCSDDDKNNFQNYIKIIINMFIKYKYFNLFIYVLLLSLNKSCLLKQMLENIGDLSIIQRLHDDTPIIIDYIEINDNIKKIIKIDENIKTYIKKLKLEK
jgi:hypothetical protein